MRNDICRKKSVSINHEQAMQVVRLLGLIWQQIVSLSHLGIELRMDPTWNPELLACSFMPLEPVGSFSPQIWLQDYNTDDRRTLRNIIRAVFQPPTVWTCTKLPDWCKLAELVGAMESGVKYSIEETDTGVVFLLDVDGGHGRLILEGIGSAGWSEQLQSRSRLFSETTAAKTMFLTDAVVRLNRFLPWLIRLAGGKVKFL